MKFFNIRAKLTRAAVGVLAAGLATGAGWAVRADAAGGATVTFTTPSSDGATITTSPVNLSGQASQPSGVVDSVDISVHWADTPGNRNRPQTSHPAQQTAQNAPQNASTLPWSFSPSLGSNGQYAVTVTAVTHQGSSGRMQTIVTESFMLDVPPARPVGLSDSVDTAHNTVSLTWVANTEDDLIGYEVRRAGPTASDPYKVIYGVQMPTTSYTDSEVAKEPPGTYRYQVAAVRYNAAGNGADVSGPSAPVYATFAPPPGSTPTTVAGGGSTGGGTPGSTGTGTPATGTAGGATPANGSGTGPAVSTTPSPRSNVVLPPVGSGLGGYQSLLGAAQTATATTEPPDTGYNPKLPYQPATGGKPVALPGELGLGAGPLGTGSGNGTSRTVEFVAGALLLAVLALFGLVLRRAADQAPPPLEAMIPLGSDHPDADGSSLLLTIFSQAPAEPPVSPEPLTDLEPIVDPAPQLVGAAVS